MDIDDHLRKEEFAIDPLMLAEPPPTYIKEQFSQEGVS
jgi:hypothetical protein